MQRVSARTLVLMLELLTAVVALQYIVAVRSPRPGAMWLPNGRPAADACPSPALAGSGADRATASGPNSFAE